MGAQELSVGAERAARATLGAMSASRSTIPPAAPASGNAPGEPGGGRFGGNAGTPVRGESGAPGPATGVRRGHATGSGEPGADGRHTTTCYMCACRCGIRVTVEGGDIRYIDGNPDHPVNQGVLCAKGNAGIMKQRSPAKLTQPMLRRAGTERGAGQFEPISWEQALTVLAKRLGDIRATDPNKLAFFTGRDQMQALSGLWATQFGTINWAAHGGFCSVNMAAGGLYSVGQSFWEFGEPDWERARLLHAVGRRRGPLVEPDEARARAAEVPRREVRRDQPRADRLSGPGRRVAADPPRHRRAAGAVVRARAAEIRSHRRDVPGRGHELGAARDRCAGQRRSRPAAARRGRRARRAVDGDGPAAALGRPSWPIPDDEPTPCSASSGRTRWPTKAAPEKSIRERRGGRGRRLRRARDHRHEPGLRRATWTTRYAPANIGPRCGIDPRHDRAPGARDGPGGVRVERVGSTSPWTDWTGRERSGFEGRPVAMHAMRGVSAHSNGFQSCRSIHLLQMLLGAIDAPGSHLAKPPFPKHPAPRIRPASETAPNTPLSSPPLGFPTGPEDLVIDAQGKPKRIDKAYSWEAPIAAHGLMHTVIRNAVESDPYPIDTLMLFMANMGWNSSMDTAGVRDALKAKRDDGEYAIPFIVTSDAFHSEMVELSDLVLPDTTYLERHDTISLLDRPISTPHSVCDAIRRPVLVPDRDVRPWQEVLLELGVRLGLPALVDGAGEAKYAGYEDFIVRFEKAPGRGLSRAASGARPGTSRSSARRTRTSGGAYADNDCFFEHPAAGEPALPAPRQPRLPRMGEERRVHRPRRPRRHGGVLRDAAPLRARRRREGAGAVPAGGRGPGASEDVFLAATGLVPGAGGRERGRGRRRRGASRSTPSRSARCSCTTPGTRRTRGCARSWRATSCT